MECPDWLDNDRLRDKFGGTLPPHRKRMESGVDGTRWLRSGDRVEAEVEGIGVLANTIAEWRDG